MIIVKHLADLEEFIGRHSAAGHQTGFVPTMGALHAGHVALLKECRGQSDIVVCSIFVNPTQFNDAADYRNYPIRLEDDIYEAEKSGADALFIPYVDEVYPNGYSNLESYDLGYLETILEGRYRPGHFQGVCQVMKRLLAMVRPDKLFMGQKDFQQCLVIEKLLSGLALPVDLVRCPTVREPDGLAMSSRNLRLTDADRLLAPAIYQTLLKIKNYTKPKSDLQQVKDIAGDNLTRLGFRVDYIEIADAGNLKPVNRADEGQQLAVLIAAYLHEVRLIDNLLING